MKTKSWLDGEFFSFSDYEKAYFTALLGNTISSHQNIIEIGFGNGNLLGWLSEQKNLSLHGIEKNKLLRQAARGKNIEIYNNLNTVPSDKKFDVIVALDVIEHLNTNELIDCFKQFSRIIRQDGIVFLRFPNGDSPFGRINQNGDLTHLNAIGIGKLGMLCKLAGLTVWELKEEPMPLFGVGIKRGISHLLIVVFRKIFSIFFGAIFFQGNFLPLGPNYIAILKLDR